MKLKMEIVGKITQLKLVEIPGKSPFLDIDIDVVLKTPSGKEYTHWVTCNGTSR